MYSDTVTMFNRCTSSTGDIWFPTVFYGCNLVSDHALMVSRYGEATSDNAILNVRYATHNGKKIVSGKKWLSPKEWKVASLADLPDCVKAQGGQEYDFFINGDFGSMGVVNDSDFLDGFYDYMRSEYDGVYAVSQVADYSVIPHIEITGR